MYSLDLIERVKSRPHAATPEAAGIHPTVWKLGLTSLLTDISSEMVSSLLPVYLVLYLHMSPLQYGTIDGIYNGIAVALLSLVGGFVADRTSRHKEVAAAGYGISALCKLLLLAAGSVWGWIAAVVALDRIGKGARTAPRDALISLCTPASSLATAFAVHRAMDAGGALLGPIVAFTILSKMPAAFDAAWVTAFVFALLGLAVLWLFVDNPTRTRASSAHRVSWREMLQALVRLESRALVLIGGLLGVVTLSDGFVYLLLQQRTGTTMGFFPLFYVATASFYMLLSVPIGMIADRFGRRRVFLLGYLALGALYLLLLGSTRLDLLGALGSLFLFGLHYAATEGVLMALASAVLSAEGRSSGLAIVGTLVNLGKMVSSLVFGFVWELHGTQTALGIFVIALLLAICVAGFTFRRTPYAKPA